MQRVRQLKIRGFREYKKWYKRTTPVDLPTNPQRHYRGKGWVSYYEFFGTNPKSNMSLGELRIDEYLQRKNIEYHWQKRFADCRDKNMLPFDFYLPAYNTIIEFDGEQHYRETKKFGKQSFEITKKHDEIKNKYCKEKGITLIRIDYQDLINNVLEWTLDNEITKIAAKQAIMFLNS